MRVGGGGAAGDDGAGLGDDRLEHRARARGGGDDGARVAAEAQAELERGPGLRGVLPLGELVAPGIVVLRPAQQVRGVAREQLRLGAGAEAQAAEAWVPFADPVGGDREQAALALDHDPAGVVERSADESDADRIGAAGVPGDARGQPLGAGAGLAEAAAGLDHPGRPVAGRGELPVVGPGVPRAVERVAQLAAEQTERRAAPGGREPGEPGDDVEVGRELEVRPRMHLRRRGRIRRRGRTAPRDRRRRGARLRSPRAWQGSNRALRRASAGGGASAG